MKKNIISAMAVALLMTVSACDDETMNRGTLNIDATQKGEPISEYIYGQFIEHLGRCIYGGLWAEMIDERKFFYPIIDEFDPWQMQEDEFWGTGPFPVLAASPWEVIGPENTVRMDTEYAYVGDHSPVV
ncbi:hypothetical protein QLX67_13075, partial [Balneolaceae bacterium ANBcel3]|nr:hypothetical protein [Balneolaceae bacterium ANBcel3]